MVTMKIQFLVLHLMVGLSYQRPKHCDCSWTNKIGDYSGCAIKFSSPNNFACKCSYDGGFTCSGEVTHCPDPNSKYCKSPDTTIGTCLQGGGNCEGYSEYADGCDCTYSSGGCKIKRPPPANTACRCSYRGAWTCQGYLIGCINPTHSKCITPDKTEDSCRQGGGDCGGY